MLRNAFDALATEGTLRQLVRQLLFAKDTQDRLRVIVDAQPAITIFSGNSSSSLQGAGQNPGPWTSSAWNVVDQRWDYGNGLNGVFNSTRSRWTIT